MNCEMLSFSQKLCEQRIAKAESLFGVKVVRKLLGYVLYLLGAKRNLICSFLDMAPGSIRTLVRSLHTKGLSSLEDQRAKYSSFKPASPPEVTLSIKEEAEYLKIDFGINDTVLAIPSRNPIQKKVVLLTLLNNGYLSCDKVASALNRSADRTFKIGRKLHQEDVIGILDRRRGHQQDYRFSPEVKAEVIQQFVIDLASQGHTSGEQISRNLHARCNLSLSPRSILNHLSNLGLSQIKKSLPAYLAKLKKTSVES